jgi:pimeloyl-ACP methyl ester carboxylesterase
MWSSLWTETTGDGPAVLWLHGLGESSLCFASIVRHPTMHGFRHRRVDLPGYGRSPWPSQAYSLDQAADAMSDVLAQDPGPVVLIGHSMGGVLAELIAERAPERIRAIINVEGNLSLGDCTFSGRAAACDLESFVATGFDELRDWVYVHGASSPALRGYYASMRFADPRVFHRHSVDLLTYSGTEVLAARAAALPMPTLYLAGSPDGICDHSKQLLDRALVRWQSVEPAGHWPFIDRPDDFAAVTSAFLSRLR